MRQQVIGVVVAVAVAFGFASCGGGSSAPTSPTAAGPTITGLTVTGPSTSVRAPETAQFAATASMSNGTTQTVTSQASWQSTNNSVATVSASGLVTAVAAGEADIRATYQGASGFQRLTVQALRLTLSGMVREEGSSGLGDARVEFTDCPNAGRSALSSNGGNYTLAELLTGNCNIRVSRSGYDTQDRTVPLSGDRTEDFALRRTSTPTPAPTPAPAPAPSPNPVPSPNGPQCNAAAYPSSASCGTPTAVCNDGTLSCSQNRSGTCSSHQGVRCWLCPGRLCNG